MSEDGQWSIHRGSILIKASTRSKYHRRGNIPPTIPDAFVSPASKYFSFFHILSISLLKEGKQIFSNEKSLSLLEFERVKEKLSRQTSLSFIYRIKTPTDFNSLSPLIAQNSTKRSGSDRSRSIPRNPSRVDGRYGRRGCFVGRANCTRRR